ncbi:MAG: DNA polymerase I, partial [bacterium]|nr:DNA polymerase I [bacterium]
VGKKKGATFADVPLKEACQYSAEDADVTFQLGEILLPKIKKDKLDKILIEVEQPLTEVLLRMESKGVKVDIPFLQDLQKEFSSRMDQKEAKIYELAGEKFNIQSPKQLSTILFEKLGLPALKKTKTGFSTDVDVLTQLSKEHDLPKEILAFRSLAKLKSTYVDALLIQANEKTQRVHTHYNQTIAETGRLSSTDPNLQNIPIRSEDGAKIRQAFIAEEGFTLLSADYSQIELRVLAHLSQDPVLLDAFKNNEDVHRKTAAGVFHVPEAKVDPEMRASGKTINFAVIYGQTPFGLSGQLNVSQKEAKQYIEDYFSRYQGVKKFRDKVLDKARKDGEVRTFMGRRRFVPDINSKNFGARSLAERIAFNTVIQGTAADIIKMAMIKIDGELRDKKLSSRMLLQVHDELVFEVKNSELESMKTLIKKHMEGVVDFKITLLVEMGQGPNWREAH